jgi:hypothetical protein
MPVAILRDAAPRLPRMRGGCGNRACPKIVLGLK